ncbi:chitin binding peritrophin-A domain-containing protein [Streptomyces arboris]|uniref:Chitin binding domain-containing protein n=1 Tax=Streptomyces arboris TaxID=2600619 RepID=A0A5N5ECD8_9ACTN|nr:chitin binding peritrophin-A domain-containing protein [Streptomyces arboris]KAB2588388.1 chitin binding domain-containing protein [Streptomyces arboris]
MIMASRMAASALLAFGALCLPAYSASAQPPSTPLADEAPVDCTNKENGLEANPNDAGSFFTCSNGATYLFHCPDNLHYDLHTQNCERPELAWNPAADRS